MRHLILTQYYPPEMGAPQARLFELAKRLQDMGHTITVLTAMPNYPTGKVFDGYRWKLRMVEKLEGIKVIRTCIYPSKSSRKIPRLLSYISFVLSSMILGSWGLGKQDVVLFESPPLFIVPAGLFIGRLTKSRIVMNCSDIWPDIIVRMGQAGAGPFLKLMLWLEKFGYKYSDIVALTNPGAARQIKERFPEVDVTVISNGVDTSFFRPDFRSNETRAGLGVKADDFVAAYCGLHGLAQGLEVIIGSAEILKDEPNIKFVMIGDGPAKNKLVQTAKERGLTNISFFGHRSKKEMPAILASCDVSLVPLVTRLPGTMPSKVYEALASGTPPIVAKACEGDSLVRKFDAGRTFEPMDEKELADAIMELASNKREYGKVRENCLALSKRFDRDIIAKRTEAVLLSVAKGKPLPDVEW